MKYKDGKISLYTRADSYGLAESLAGMYFLTALNADALFVVDIHTNIIIELTTQLRAFCPNYMIKEPREQIYDMLAKSYTMDRFVKRIYD